MQKAFFSRRLPPGFTVGECCAYVGFHLVWPLLHATLFQVTGIFGSKNFITLEDFALLKLCILPIEMILLVPFWWLYFVALRHKPLSWRVMGHGITGFVYAGAALYGIYLVRAVGFGMTYNTNMLLSDYLFILLFYLIDFAVFHAYNLWLDTRRRQQEQLELQALLQQGEIAALKAQIEPHFLFNTLNTISASVPPEFERTRVLIAHLADTFRYNLAISERHEVPLREELDFLRTWLLLEQHRFGGRLRLDFHIDDTVLDAPVPPMILQPLVENALNHGILPKVEGGTVTIACVREDGHLRLAVSDDGVGYAGPLTEICTRGVGLRNITRRLHLLYGSEMEVEGGDGLQFSFRIPYEKEGTYR
ncbi:MAG: sensor histidine kinase [Chitinophagaceae bacterium]|nr:MAG: sensor histidine kinase [Chitinophagaceae bacterium]